MTRQSLESEIERMLELYTIDAAYAARRQKVGSLRQEKEIFKQALLKTVNLYVEERERLAKEEGAKEIMILVGRTPIDSDAYAALRAEADKYIKALRQQVKGGKDWFKGDGNYTFVKENINE